MELVKNILGIAMLAVGVFALAALVFALIWAIQDARKHDRWWDDLTDRAYNIPKKKTLWSKFIDLFHSKKIKELKNEIENHKALIENEKRWHDKCTKLFIDRVEAYEDTITELNTQLTMLKGKLAKKTVRSKKK